MIERLEAPASTLGFERGKTSSIIVVSEGRKPGLCQRLAHDLEKRGYHARVAIIAFDLPASR